MVIGIRSQKQSLPDSVDLKDGCYVIDKPPEYNGSFRTCEVTLKDDIVPCCPKCGHTHVIRKGMRREPFVRWDIVKRMPTQVSLHVRMWQCKNEYCKYFFADPRSPYQTNEKTTAAFDIYIAETLLSSTSLPQSYLAKRFRLSESKISDILSTYISNSKHKLPPAIPCETLWFVPFRYQKKLSLLVLGRPDRQLRRFYGSSLWNRMAFLGISDEYSLESAFNRCNIKEPEKVRFIYCPASLRRKEDAARLIERHNLKVLSLSHPNPIFWWSNKLFDILKDFQARGFSLKQAGYMMRYTHAYRTPIIQKNTMQNNAFSKRIRGNDLPFQYESSVGKLCFYVDAEALIHIYGKQ